jgi:hemoglobin/transferrin/lactoferrin receptor protein
VTGNARLGWHPVEPSTIFAGISQGFRAPNLSNLTGIQSRASSNIQTEGNPDLKPEKSLTYEVGAKYEEQRDSAALTFFYTDLTDLIQTTYIDVNGDGAITAVDRSRSDNANSGELAGFELAHDWGILAASLPTDTRLAIFNVINAVTGEAEVENGQGVVETQHISRANRVFGQGGVTFEPTTAWYVTFQTRWSMAYKEPAPGDATDVRHTTFGYADGGMPGYAVLDLKAGYRWNKAIRLDGALENLLNHSYREVGSGIDGAGLSGVVRVTARY